MNMIISFDLQVHCSWFKHQDVQDTNVEKGADLDSILQSALREKCPYSELFWSVFSRIWTECGPE